MSGDSPHPSTLHASVTTSSSAMPRFLAPGEFVIARRIFAHLLGAILFCAFVSLWCQVLGLIGVHGIVPAGEFLRAAQQQLGAASYWQIPTLCWLSSSDNSLLIQCATGVALSLILLCGWCPGPCALLCWALYLSLSTVTSPFLDFQWDTLLLETAFLAAFFLPWRIRPDWRRQTHVVALARLLLCWLLFRLIFESGVVKLSSGDPAWRTGTSLQFHFETQPLPLWPAWFAHQAPTSILKLSTWGMFAVELCAPFFILGSRRYRHPAAWAIIALQAVILVTGNYAFFNYLTIALCILLFDDAAWRFRGRQKVATPPLPALSGAAAILRFAIFAAVALIALLITGSGLIGSFHLNPPFASWHALAAPLRTFNTYGLFAVMTTTRPEIIVEGSSDGTIWREYEFKWKPGDIRARPRLVAPHQPRLDWQMWFAALGDVRSNPWFVQFLVKLLHGSSEVLRLLETNPFPEHPPRYIRAVLYEYHFTRPGDGAPWWKRERNGLYCPPLELKNDQTLELPNKMHPFAVLQNATAFAPVPILITP